MTYIEKTRKSYYPGFAEKVVKDYNAVIQPLGLPDAIYDTTLEMRDRECRYSYLTKSAFERLNKTLRKENPENYILSDDWEWNDELKKYVFKYNLLGEYIPNEKKVILYEKNIEDACTRDDVPYYCGELTTYIHEIFHAVHHKATVGIGKSYEPIREIEEAMTEFSTLVLLAELKGWDFQHKLSTKYLGDENSWGKVFDWALMSIKRKQNYFGDMPAYGFGYYLFNTLYYQKTSSNDEAYRWIEKYNQKIGAIVKKKRYVKWCQQMLNPVYPYKDEKLCLELLNSILFH